MPKYVEDNAPKEKRRGFCLNCGKPLSCKRSLRCRSCNAKQQWTQNERKREWLITHGHVCERCGGAIFPWNRSGYCMDCYGRAYENRRKYRQKYERKPQTRYQRWPHRLECKLCHKMFRPHLWQHPKWTYYCDHCRLTRLPEISSGLRWTARGYSHDNIYGYATE